MKKLLKWLLILTLAGGIFGTLALGIAWLVLSPNLPTTESLKDVQLQVPLRIYTRDGQLIATYGEKRRQPVTIDDVPDAVKNAFLAGEDARFYEHPGVDYQGIMRAVWYIIRTGGDKGPGGSTITMQLTRQFFLSFERTYLRKLKEIFLALKIEQELSKDQILELYLNKIFLGHRAYGIAAAADVYYGKSLDELTLAEAAMIASLPKAPSRINPINNPERALARRNYVLGRMHELDFIDQATWEQAVAEVDRAHLHVPTSDVHAPHLAEMVRATVVGQLGDAAYTSGYKIITTIDSRLQQAAEMAVRSGLALYDRRHGYRGAEAKTELADASTPADWASALEGFRASAGLAPGLVVETSEHLASVYLVDGQTIPLDLEAVAWARPYIDADRRGASPKRVDEVLAAGDIIRVERNAEGEWRLAQLPLVEGALVSMNPKDGAVRALIGGFDFNRSKFNRATQGKRQPGSSFKPVVYSAALESGMTVATLINDAPVVFNDPQLERVWRPENYSRTFYGPTRLREGMVNSRNLVSIRVLRETGVQTVHDYALRFGFSAGDLPADLSLALGSGPVPPLAMARAYSVFANGGYLIEPYFVERIINANGAEVYSSQPLLACEACGQDGPIELEEVHADTLLPTIETDEDGPVFYAEQVIDPRNAYVISSVLRDVIRRGTGRPARALGRDDLAGKTGTTNDQRDAWFSGFNHHLVTTAWVGHDDFSPLGKGEVGGRAALPIWIDFMREALEGVPERPFNPPPGVTIARIDPDTGLLARADNPNAIDEVFLSENLPEAEPARDAEQTAVDPYDIF